MIRLLNFAFIDSQCILMLCVRFYQRIIKLSTLNHLTCLFRIFVEELQQFLIAEQRVGLVERLFVCLSLSVCM